MAAFRRRQAEARYFFSNSSGFILHGVFSGAFPSTHLQQIFSPLLQKTQRLPSDFRVHDWVPALISLDVG